VPINNLILLLLRRIKKRCKQFIVISVVVVLVSSCDDTPRPWKTVELTHNMLLLMMSQLIQQVMILFKQKIVPMSFLEKTQIKHG